jgi:peroxiredoxin
MKEFKNILHGTLVLVFCAALSSSIAQNSTNVNHEMHQAKADSTKEYTIVKSWEHIRELYIKRGMSDAKADSMISEHLAVLSDMDRAAGDDRIGIKAPPFKFDGWLNSEPLTLEELKGKVVLVRWFTDTCPYCASSTPALRGLYEDYSDKGLTIVGVYHPKAGRNDPLNIARVQRVVETREFKFPVGIDWDWRNNTLKDWWLTGPERPGTSVTFILDKSGVIRFVHPGMEYHEDNGSEQHLMCSNDLDRIQDAIEQLLAE